ncbi:hypothetical protein CHUAL_002856 [Chamberlinius hualienensis]
MSYNNEIDIDKLIEEVEKRPALYNKNSKDFNDVKLRKKLWEDVGEAVVCGWSELSGHEREKLGLTLHKRWTSLRSCFRREINVQKKLGQNVRKRRKYIYYEQLLFLLPTMENESTETDYDDNDEINKVVEEQVIITSPRRKIQPRTKLQLSEEDESLVNTNLQLIEADEDTNFALSIVPSLRELSPDDKLEAKIEILKVFKNICAHNVTRQPKISTIKSRQTLNM